MKLSIFLFLLSLQIFGSESSSSFEESLKISKEKEVPLFIEFYTDWCRYCKILSSRVIPHPTIQETLQNFHTVRINGDKEESLTERYNIRGYPTLIILDPDETILVRIDGLPSIEFLYEKLRYALSQKEAKTSLLKQIEKEPNSPLHLYNLARLYYEQEQYEKSHNFSLRSYQNSTEILERKKDALFLIGMSLLRLKRFEESISIWNQFLVEYPEEDSGTILYYRGISYLENGEREKSKQDLKTCIQTTKNEAIKSSAIKIYNTNFRDK